MSVGRSHAETPRLWGAWLDDRGLDMPERCNDGLPRDDPLVSR